MLVASPSDNRCAPGCSLYSRERVLLCFFLVDTWKHHLIHLTRRRRQLLTRRLQESTRALSRACSNLSCTYSHLWLTYVDSYSCLPCTNIACLDTSIHRLECLASSRHKLGCLATSMHKLHAWHFGELIGLDFLLACSLGWLMHERSKAWYFHHLNYLNNILLIRGLPRQF